MHVQTYLQVCLAPNYNIPEIPEALQEEYTILTYKDLHEYLIDNEVRKEWCEDTNFSAFVEAIRKHTYAYIGDYLRNEMEEIFMRKMSGSCWWLVCRYGAFPFYGISSRTPIQHWI